MHIRNLLALTVLNLPLVAHAAGITDYSSHKPPSITYPSAGGSYTDPVFGTKIIRVTDSRYGTRCYHAYSYWPAFNYNDTRLLLACDDKALLFRFDPATDTLTADGTLQGSDGYHVQWEGALWSQISADVIYATDQNGLRIWRIDVGHRGAVGYSLMADFTSRFGTGVRIFQLTMSDDANTFAFHTVDRATGKALDAVVWVRNLGKVYVMPRQANETLDENKVDKDGQVMMANFSDDNAAIWDFHTGSVTMLKQTSSVDDVGGHFDLGHDYITNADVWNTGLVVRGYGSLRAPANIVQYKRSNGTLNWSLCDHASVREGIEDFVVGSTYCGDGTYGAFEKEIYLAYTDGHGFVRLAHTRSLGNEADGDGKYRAQPRAVVDGKGRYIVYTSDLGSSTRTDVMIPKIPSAYWPY
jgi:hypothetical protein